MKKIHASLFIRVFLITLLLLGFGLIMIYSASVAEALRDFGNKWYFVSLQLKWAGVGLVLMLLLSRFPAAHWEKLALPLLIGGLALLLLVAIPGIGTKVQGARRWLVLPGITLQPSELIKFVEVVYLSSWLTKHKVTLKQFLIFLGLIAGLIMLQPDMGTALVVTLLAIAMYYFTGAPSSHFLMIGGLGITVVVILVAIAPYRLARFTTFLDPSKDPQGSSYHIRQVILALGSGGMTGLGVGKSRQKYEYLPEATTDSIFAVVGEELGFIGATLLIGTFVYLLSLIFKVATQARHQFSASLAAGIGSWIGIQVLLNLASMVALTPLTGVPLPLVSYGGSALVTILAGVGLLLSVIRTEKL
ncbi:MAG: putative lipid II flippase FtsW [bacterium]